MEYVRYPDVRSFYDAMLGHAERKDADFIDAIVHARDHFTLCLGRFVDRAPYTSDYTGVDIFYKSTRARNEDYLTTFDYFFRYDTESHWLAGTLPGLEHPTVRRLVGKHLLGSTNLLAWSRRLRPIMKHIRYPFVILDVFIPSNRFLDFYEWYERTVDHYPLWLVPYRTPHGPYPWLDDAYAARIGTDLFIDCAVYGKRNPVRGPNYYRLLEDKTRELHGIKTLISENHYDERTFWSIYNKAHYDQVKHETDPGNLLRGLYEKFHFGR
jgi:hypothetical protein